MKIIVTPEAEKQYIALAQASRIKVRKRIALLEVNPHAGKKLSGQFSTLRSLRAWPYRILYTIEHKEIYIVTIVHRQSAYR